MRRTLIVLAFAFTGTLAMASDKPSSHPAFNYEAARAHEIKPHRRTIPMRGVTNGFNQLRLTLIISPTGDVIRADASDNEEMIKYWPQLQGEVAQWKFTPFEVTGKAVTAEITEYIDLVPPERFPKVHAAPPLLRPDSKVKITLQRSGCYGSCPAYSVTISTEGTTFSGHRYVVATGQHKDTMDADAVRKLAKKFVADDFYSMDASYRAGVTDCPTYMLAISIDGHAKETEDYMGSWVGMPAVIAELEDEVDALARTDRWIEGSKGLVSTLRQEEFNFQTYEAQVMLKGAATRGQAETVRDFLEAGVPLKPLPAPTSKEADMSMPFDSVGWLNAAARYPDVLKILIAAQASAKDQADKNLALAEAARSGSLVAVRALIADGADPNADLRALTITESGGGMSMQGKGAGSILIYAAESGNPDVLREILGFHPSLEIRDYRGKTAMFRAGEYRFGDSDGARVECVRLLAKAGADVNARDNDGNTPLHETYLTDVEEELLKLGANVNARNKKGETPIFTTFDNDAIPLFIEHGADLTIRNAKGQTVMEAAEDKGPQREEALRKAIQQSKER